MEESHEMETALVSDNIVSDLWFRACAIECVILGFSPHFNQYLKHAIDAFQSPVSLSAPLTGRLLATTGSHCDILLTQPPF
jgi:hypothetical protein